MTATEILNKCINDVMQSELFTTEAPVNDLVLDTLHGYLVDKNTDYTAVVDYHIVVNDNGMVGIKFNIKEFDNE